MYTSGIHSVYTLHTLYIHSAYTRVGFCVVFTGGILFFNLLYFSILGSYFCNYGNKCFFLQYWLFYLQCAILFTIGKIEFDAFDCFLLLCYY